MIKVMLIEDDPMVRDINIKFTNKVSDFKVVDYAASVLEAKEIIKENLPDLILLDIFLPNGNGLELLRWIRSLELNCDVILITAETRCGVVQEALRYGAVDYLVKPFTFQRFKDALEQYKKRYDSMITLSQIQQDTIDNFVLSTDKIKGAKEEVNLIKGLSIHTYDQINSFISDKMTLFTADELADETGMARVTVRRYLDYMVKENKLELQIEYGKIGRPTHFYKTK
jgi:response regulator of citrate/malate metabolism